MKVIDKEDDSSYDQIYGFENDENMSKLSLRTDSYRTSINNSQKSQSENLSGLRKRKPDLEQLNQTTQEFIDDNDVVPQNITKTIEFDNILLSITYKEHLVFEEITRIFTLVDNVFRVFLPFVFFIVIIVLFSNE